MDGYEAFSTSLTPNFEKFGSKKVKNLSLAGEMDPPPSFRELVEFRCAQCKVRETLQKRLRAMKWRRGDFYWGPRLIMTGRQWHRSLLDAREIGWDFRNTGPQNHPISE